MATIGMLVGGAIVNALAFSGSNFVFSLFGDKKTLEEQKRHNQATEALTRARDQWNQKRAERLDYINTALNQEHKAEGVFQDVDEAMREYSLVTGRNLPSLGPRPELADFYTPSDDQENRELLFLVLGLTTTGVLVFKFI